MPRFGGCHLYPHGISLREGCVGNVIRQCLFHDLGGGGLYLSEGSPPGAGDGFLTAHNVVDNNFIHDGGKLFRAACGVFLGGSASFNRIHDISRFERGNEGYGGWGIYLDAGSSEIVVENNVVFNTRDGGLHVHCAGHPHDNTVRNNVFAFSQEGQWMRNNTDEPDTNHVHCERNIVANANPRMLWGGNWADGSKFTADYNCYWSEAGPPDFNGRSLAEWQKAGRDRHSIVADPRFVNPREYDFRLQPDSPALALGIVPIDIEGAGLTGPDGATTAKEGLPFLQPEFQVCTWCGFVGIDAQPAVFYVDDIRLE